MSRTGEDPHGTRMDRHVARHLGISRIDLSNHPYEIDEITTEDGASVALRVSWIEAPPPDVNAQGGPSKWWNVIPLADPNNSEISAAAALSVIASSMTPEMKAAFAKSSQAGPLSRLDMLTIGNQMTRFMHNVVSTIMAMDGHNLESLDKLSQATTVIDDFATSVLDGAHWRFDFPEGGNDK